MPMILKAIITEMMRDHMCASSANILGPITMILDNGMSHANICSLHIISNAASLQSRPVDSPLKELHVKKCTLPELSISPKK